MAKEGKHKLIMIGGVALIALAFAADSLGLGTSANFGYKQIILLVAGLGLLSYSCKSCKK